MSKASSLPQCIFDPESVKHQTKLPDMVCVSLAGSERVIMEISALHIVSVPIVPRMVASSNFGLILIWEGPFLCFVFFLFVFLCDNSESCQ